MYSKAVDIRPDAGDIVIFDARVIHGTTNRVGNRYNLFVDYGMENAHTYDHVNYYLRERKDENYSLNYDEELKNELKERNLFLEGIENFHESPLTGRHSLYPEEAVLAHYNT